MNWKLIILTSISGTLLGVVMGCLIFFGAPGLSNFNVEEYIAVCVLVIASLAAFYAYHRAAARKSLHAFLVFVGVWAMLVAIVLFLIFLLIAICSIWQCRIFPFL